MPHPGLLQLILQSPSVSRAATCVAQEIFPVAVVGLHGYGRIAFLASVFSSARRPAVLVVPDPEEAITARRDLADILGPEQVLLFPAREVMPFEAHGNRESLWVRISSLASLVSGSGGPRLVVLPATSLMRKLMPPDKFLAGCRRISLGDEISAQDFVRFLVEHGYERVYSVENRGQVALRGGILDIFPPSSEWPFRIELAYDRVESIRMFDPETQNSTEHASEVFVTPASDSLDGLDNGMSTAQKEPDARGSSSALGSDLAGSGESTIFEYAGRDALIFVDNLDKCNDALREFERTGAEVASARMVAGTMSSQEANAYFPASYIESHLARGHFFLSLIPRLYDGITFKQLVESDFSVQVGFSSRWNEMLDEFRHLVSNQKRVVILAGNEERKSLLEKRLRRQDIPLVSSDSIETIPLPGVVTLALGGGEGGFNCEATGLALFTEREVYGRSVVRQRRVRKARAAFDWRELVPGDYVVHANHGIGQFMGIKTMTVNGATRDYLHIRYAGSDALYVPVDQVDLIEKYSGPEGKPPALHRLGTGEWQKIKARVKRSLEDMAKKLIMLEARRKSRKGYAFSPDTPWQRQFEESFEYEETEDQARATEEIKRDMEKPVPMDRLLCGDVGFGKTEVAMRCAFKAVMDSKQVAVLVPTTILAEQHYSTFSRRFADYPVTIAVLSRFRSPAEQKKILRDLELGAIDIIIGTHRLLSKDVKFKDLGLLIIDEEHRFGVAQKERLKEISETCDVLTLTATPIPRTLNMALSGLRDISLIQTPPEGRFPVETYVVPYNPTLIAQAIRREMRRGGQVFYVYNRIISIGRALQKIQALVPEARVTVAHGKMSEQELSVTMQDFLQGRYDVLVSTTIIESGLDLPNVNTLIVEDADRFGLAQLYQLRGRVGRSMRVAYAYFMYRPDKAITPEAEQRLNALRDFAGMGSGFRLAMRDLEIRGAGNLLGKEQHGFIALVGYEMYLHLLEKAIRSLKGEKEEITETIRASVEIPCDAYLPESYVESPRDRFSFYKRIAAADELDVLSDIQDELEDRFGPLPEVVKNLLNVARVRILASKMGITQVSLVKEDLTFGRERLTFKIEVPHLFPFDRLQNVSRVSRNLDYDKRASMLFAAVPRSSAHPLLLALDLLRVLAGR